MARPCFFCGGEAKTKEHIFGKSLTDHVFGKVVTRLVTDRATGGRRYSEERQVLDEYWTGAPTKTVSVCSDCNSGWMSDLESLCIGPLGRMAQGETVLLDPDTQENISRWAMKTAISWEAATREENERVVPRAVIDSLVKEGEIARTTTRVELLAYIGPRSVSYTGTKGSPRKRDTYKEAPVYHVTLLVQHLVISVFGFTGLTPELLPESPLLDPFLVRIFPPGAAAVQWPPPVWLGDAALFDFQHENVWFDPQGYEVFS
jgi:hypothetical protein